MACGPLAGVLPLGLRLQPVLRPPRHHLVRVRGRRAPGRTSRPRAPPHRGGLVLLLAQRERLLRRPPPVARPPLARTSPSPRPASKFKKGDKILYSKVKDGELVQRLGVVENVDTRG